MHYDTGTLFATKIVPPGTILVTGRYNFRPVSQENLSPGNCVAATVFPQEIMSLTINVATVYPKEILSSGNTVAPHAWIGPNMTYTTASFLL